MLDSDDPEIRGSALAEYLKLGYSVPTVRSLVREGMSEVKVTLESADEPLSITGDWSANEREEDIVNFERTAGAGEGKGERNARRSNG